MKNLFKQIISAFLFSSLLLSPVHFALGNELSSNKGGLGEIIGSEKTRRKKIEKVLNQFNGQEWKVTYNIFYFIPFPTDIQSKTDVFDSTGMIRFNFLPLNKCQYIITHLDIASGKPIRNEWKTPISEGNGNFDYKLNQIYHFEYNKEICLKIDPDSTVYDFSSAIIGYLSQGIEEGQKTLNVLFRGKISPYIVDTKAENESWRISIISGKKVLGCAYVNKEGIPIKGEGNFPFLM